MHILAPAETSIYMSVRLLSAPAETSSCNRPKAGKSFAAADGGGAEAPDGGDGGGAAQAGDAGAGGVDGGSGHHLLGVDG